MKELGITKGECKVRGRINLSVYAKTDLLEHPICIMDFFDKTKKENKCNANLITDAFNTAQKANLLPSELLERYDEAIEVLKKAQKFILHSPIRIHELDKMIEQTISKANRE